MRLVFWAVFALLIVAFLALDLGVLHRRAREVSLREALGWSGVWIAVALAFGGALFVWRGADLALQYLTGYLIEKVLSIDILFVFMLILGYFQVPARFQHTVLFWGIIGALLMRLALIALGLSLIQTFHWVVYVFGGFLVLTGFRLLLRRERAMQPGRNVVARAVGRVLPVTSDFADGRFLTRRDGRLMATPLLPALLVVESTDLLFALDSIPAVLAITRDPLVVYSANVFALLGMRALYFALAGIVPFFHYLHRAFGAILVLAGARLLAAEWYELPVSAVLGLVIGFLLVAMVASVVRPREDQVQALLAQGSRTGEFQAEEVELVERVFDLGDRQVGGLMTPRPDMVWLDPDEPRPELARKVRSAATAQLPVAEGSLDRLVGVVDVRELLASLLDGSDLDLRALARDGLLVPEHTPALELLDRFRESAADTALVVDEYGSVQGVVTVRDVVRAATGPAGAAARPGGLRRGDGEEETWEVQGTLPLEELAAGLDLPPVTVEERATYRTVAGLALRQVGRVPERGDRFTWRELSFEVVHVQDRRVRALRVRRHRDGPPADLGDGGG